MKTFFKKSICVFLTLLLTLPAISTFSFAATPKAYKSSVILNGKVVSNELGYESPRYGNIENSYLQANSDGTLSRITGSNENVCIDTYSADFKYIKTKTIKNALPIFGGFYSGSKYNFCIFGQKNPNEKNNCEVIKIVKYTKDWAEAGSVSLKGANTTIPFSFGSARMYESKGNLYIHTCHEMYKSPDDGLNHQANLQIHVNIDKMEILYSFYKALNLSSSGYCSHSLDQYIRSDGSYVYTVDHGDAHPRYIAVCKKQPSGKLIKYTSVLNIQGEFGDTNTGVSLGGFEMSDKTLIIAGNTSSQKSGQNRNIRNIFVTVTDKDLNNTKFIQLTDFKEAYAVSKPTLVKINSNKFIVMWNEFEKVDDQSVFKCMRAVAIDAQGKQLQKIKTDAKVSDCDPIVSNGKLIWYTNDIFYSFVVDEFKNYDGYNNPTRTSGYYSYKQHLNAVEITKYSGKEELVRVPSEFNGLPVYSIKNKAFAHNDNILILILPDTLRIIDDYAFNYCRYLKHVFIPDGVTYIGQFAFSSCYHVTYLVLPKSIKTLGYAAFYCSKLDNIYYQGSESDWNKLNTKDVFNKDAKNKMHYNCNIDYYHYDFGDVNLDSKFSAQDALIILQHATGLKTMKKDQLRRSDVSKDGNLNSSDALLILQRSTGLIKNF